jgi:phytoene/squalene synthetase
MDDLVRFLLARIGEDEEVARAATPGPWFANGAMNENSQVGTGMGVVGKARDFPGEDRRGDVVSVGVEDDGGAWWPDAQHIARHDPARVLAECDAKRRIVAEADAGHGGYPDGVYFAVRALALPYADHPDYRPEWRP